MEQERGYKKALGSRGEDIAVAYLKKQGYLIKERNYNCYLGELDIIALHQGMLVFVEVRSNSSAYAGLAEASIGFRKQRKLRQVATYYLKVNGMLQRPCRFDVVIVLLNRGSMQSQQVKLIKNAF